MNRFLKVLFIIVIVAMGGAMICQLLFPEVMGIHSSFGISLGWQREIGYWNIAIIVLLIGVYRKYDWYFLSLTLLSLIIGGIGIGSNHLYWFLRQHSEINAIGAIENYLLVIAWIIGWGLEWRRKRWHD